jgi:hypothetical protein
MVRYIHELKGWPHFRWSQERLAKRLAAVRHQQGRLIGRMEGLGFTLRAEAMRIQSAFESAGIRFLDNDAGGGIGVRLVHHGQLG